MPFVKAVLCPRIVGRDSVLGALDELLRRTAAGDGAALALVGDAGLGKSRLARAAVECAAQHGLVVAVGRCGEADARVPLRPFSQAVAGLLRDRPLPSSPAVAPYRAVLGRLAPELGPEGGVLPGGPVEPEAVHLGEGLLRLLQAISPRGALLVVEDVHQADVATLAVLEHLVDAVSDGVFGRTSRVSVLVTLRPGASPPVALISRLRDRRVLQALDLSPLSAPKVRELALACLPGLDASTVQAVVERCGGVPFLVEELLAACIGEDGSVDGARAVDVVPLTLADAVRRRVAALPADSRRLLDLAAVAGLRSDIALLAGATGSTAERVQAALQPALGVQLLSTLAPCEFRHAITRDAVLLGLLPAERTAAARLLHDVADQVGAEPALVASLAERADRPGDAARAWLALAADAVAAGAPSGAEEALRHAAGLLPAQDDPALAAELALSRLDALAQAGRAEEVRTLAAELLSGRSALHEPVTLRQVGLAAARAALEAGDLESAAQAAPLADQARENGDDVTWARATALAALVAIAAGDLAAAEAHARAVLTGSGEQQVPQAHCEAWEVLGRLVRPHDLAAARAAFSAGLQAADRAGLTLWTVRALHELGTVDMFITCRPDRLLEARASAVAAGALSTVTVLDVQVASCLALALDTDRALAVVDDAVAGARRVGARPLEAAAQVAAAMAHSFAGRPEQATQAGRRAVRLSGGSAETLVLLAGLAEGMGGLLQEDRERARRGFADMARHAQRAVNAPPSPSYGLRALLVTVDGEPTAAQVRDDVRRCRATTAPYNALLVGYAEAVAAGAAGKPDQAQRLLAAAEHALPRDATGEPVKVLQHLGRRLVAERAVADGWGEPAAWLRAAAAAFDLTAPEVAAACRRLLRAAGERAPRPAAAPLPEAARRAGVTPREHEVLLLVVLGASNADVAARLHLSPRTVETHVARLLQKTGVARRGLLAQWLAAEVSGLPAEGP